MSAEIISPGMNAFTQLRAEDEPWLPRAFHFPRDFIMMTGAGSAIIYSEPGGGRSALLAMMQQIVLEKKDTLLLLPVTWRPPVPEHWEQKDIQEKWRQALLQKMAMDVLVFFAQHPQLHQGLPKWARAYVNAFILAFAPGSLDFELMRLQEESPEASHVWLKELRIPKQDMLLSPETVRNYPVSQIIKRLIEVIQRANFKGIWLLMDGFEQWQANLDLDQEMAKELLQRFFSTLAYFDQPGLAFKMATPINWQAFLSHAHGVKTRRVAEFELEWDTEDLLSIISKRLAFVSNGKITALNELCETPEALHWLQRYGGRNPRRWLAWTGELYSAFLDAGGREPISADMWQRIRRRLSPYLRITDEKKVLVGAMEVSGLSESLFRVLEYLYIKNGAICSRQELYTRAYRPEEDLPYGWEKSMETVIWRLRQAVEPDPRHPIFIITERSRGVRLARTR